jgi:hypothetical protein
MRRACACAQQPASENRNQPSRLALLQYQQIAGNPRRGRPGQSRHGHSPEIGSKEFQTLAFEVPLGGTLTQLSIAQMEWLGFPAPQRCEPREPKFFHCPEVLCVPLRLLLQLSRRQHKFVIEQAGKPSCLFKPQTAEVRRRLRKLIPLPVRPAGPLSLHRETRQHFRLMHPPKSKAARLNFLPLPSNAYPGTSVSPGIP